MRVRVGVIVLVGVADLVRERLPVVEGVLEGVCVREAVWLGVRVRDGDCDGVPERVRVLVADQEPVLLGVAV